MGQPLVQIIEALLRVDSVDEDADLHIANEQVCQVMHVPVASCIPNVQLDAVLLASDHYFDYLAKVRDHRCSQSRIVLWLPFHECLDDTSLTYCGVTHEYNLSIVNLVLFFHGS